MQKVLDFGIESNEKELIDIDKDMETIRAQASTKMELNLIDGLEENREEKKKGFLIDDLFGYLPENEDQTGSVSIFLDIIFKKKFHEVLRLKNLKEQETVLKELSTIIPRIVEKKAKSKKELWEPLPQDFLKEIEGFLQEQFPGIGKNNYRKARSIKFQEAARQLLIRHFGNFILKKIDQSYKEFTSIEMLIYNACDRIDETFDNTFLDTYKKRVIICAAHEIKPRYERSTNQKQEPRKIQDIETTEIFNERIKEAEKIFVIPAYRQSLFDSHPQKDEIIKYITRLAKNRREIRIPDLTEKFDIDENLFTTEFIAKSWKDKIYLIKESAVPKPIEPENPEEKNQEEIIVPEKIRTPKDEKRETIEMFLLENRDRFSADLCIEALHMCGYTIPKIRHFKKNFKRIYATDDKKAALATELKEKIFIPSLGLNAKNGKQYRTLDLDDDNRILFLEKNIIDGIYMHNEYMRRLSNQK